MKKLILFLSIAVLIPNIYSMQSADQKRVAETLEYERQLSEHAFRDYVKAFAMPDGYAELSEESMNALMNSVDDNLMDMVGQFLDPNVRGFGSHLNTVLLHGVPGVGKTCFGPAMSRYSMREVTIKKDGEDSVTERIQIPCVIWNCGRIADRFKSDGPQKIHEFLQLAIGSGKPYIIVLDEMEALFKKDQNKNDGDVGMMEALLEKAEQVKGTQLFLICTTNSTKDMRAALRDRVYYYEFKMPHAELRESIIRIEAQKLALDEETAGKLVDITKGLNLREIAKLFKFAKTVSWRRALNAAGITRVFNEERKFYTARPKPTFQDFVKAKQSVLKEREENPNSWKRSLIEKSKEVGNNWLMQIPSLSVSAVGIGLGVFVALNSNAIAQTGLVVAQRSLAVAEASFGVQRFNAFMQGITSVIPIIGCLG